MPAIRLFAGSVYGTALEVAQDIEEALEDQGFDVRYFPQPTLSDFTGDGDNSAVLLVTATTGEGELPGNLLPLYQQLMDTLPQQPGRIGGVIVLGDSAYGDTFCAAGNLLEELMQQLAYTPVCPSLRIDAADTPEPATVAVPWALTWARRVTEAPQG
ncbi:MAG: flavodoxin [Halomonadaceae bacterium]|nr:MAG: flavodoxin [Halomonadaceae bacterium]